MAAYKKEPKGMELCRGCKESFRARKKALNYEGYCTRCIVAREKARREEAEHAAHDND